MLELAIEHNRHRFIILLTIFVIFSLILCFLFLQFNFSYKDAIIWFLPMAAVTILMIYYLTWFTSMVMTRLIDVGNTKFNSIFSLTSFELFVVFVGFQINEGDVIATSTFVLCLVNLILCYSLTCVAMRMVLRETTVMRTTCFTHRNLWKVAITLLMEFVVELTFFCYLGSLYFPDAYSTQVNLFDLFYYTVITFGTVGYGDIYPIHPLARLLVTLEAVTGVLFIGLSMARSLMLISEDDDSDLPR